jgi:hypothetical protein
MIRKLATRTLVGLAATVALVGLAAMPAQAVIVSTDAVRITEQQLDFGRNWVTGAPINSGDLDWDVTGGLVTPILNNGNIYINNAAGTCARMRVEAYDANHVLLTSRNGGTVCAPNGALHSWSVNFGAPGHANTEHAHVILQVQTAGGGYIDVATVFEDL